MILVVDNAKKDKGRKMTPKLYEFLTEGGFSFVSLSKGAEFERLKHLAFKGIILSGSGQRLSEMDETRQKVNCSHELNLRVLAFSKMKGIPVLGICFGFQVMCFAEGGKVCEREEDLCEWRPTYLLNDPLFDGMVGQVKSFFYQCSDCVSKVPASFVATSLSPELKTESVRHRVYPWWGTQYHPEASGLPGYHLLHNFIRICLFCPANSLKLF